MYVAAPVVALTLLWLVGIRVTRFSLPSLFVLLYLALAHIGILPLYFGWDEYSISIGIERRDLLFKVGLLSSLALVVSSVGLAFATFVLQAPPDRYRPTLVKATRGEYQFMLLVFTVCVVVFALYISQVNAIALVRALQGDIAGAAVARSEMGNAFPGKYWRYRLFFRTILDYTVVFFYAHHLAKRRGGTMLVFCATFGVAVLTATIATEKAPLAMLMISLYLAYVMYKGGRYWQPATKYAAVVGVIVLSASYIYLMGTTDVATAVQQLAGRVFAGQISPAYFYVDLFPNRLDYLWGSSMPNPGGLLPFDQFPLTRYVEQHMAGRISTTIIGSAPTVYWGEMYANFGFAGVVISSLMVGIGLGTLSAVLTSLTPSPVVIAATIAFAGHYSTLTMTSFSDFLIDAVFVALAGLTLMTLLLRRSALRPRPVILRPGLTPS
jgi:hypothetical protein